VLKALRQLMPKADVVYFGDIRNAPYGQKTQAELSALTMHAVDLLRHEHADRIISACNSVAASLVISLSDRIRSVSSDMIEMVGPTVAHFEGNDTRLALCATVATIDSGIYQNAFELIGQNVQYVKIPDLAGAIESGAPESVIETIITEAFKEGVDFGTLILACTHYPLVFPLFERVLPGVRIFDPSMTVAERAQKTFPSESEGSGTTRFIISQESVHFRRLVETFFEGREYTIEVREA
jgi:glutamate racemase